MAAVTDIITRIRADASQFKSEMAGAEASSAKLGASTSKLQQVGKVAFLGLAAGAAAVGVASVKMAMDFEEAHTRLSVAFKQAGTSMEVQSSAVEALDSKMRNLGFTDASTETGFARLVTATRNVGKSTSDMALAADIARARNIDLVSATDMLVKVEGGRYIALSKTLGVSKDIINSFHSTADAIDYLQGRFGGSAAAATDDFAVKLQILGAQLEHVAVQIGEALIPVIEGMGTALAATVDFFERNHEAAVALAVVVGGPLLAAMLSYLAASAASALSAIAQGWANIAAAARAAAAATDVALLSVVGIGAAVVGAALVIDHFVDTGEKAFAGFATGVKKAEDAGKKLGETYVAAANVSAAPLESLRSKLADLEQKQRGVNAAYDAGKLSAAEAAAAHGKYAGAIDVVKGAIADYKQKQAEADAANRTTVGSLEAVANGTIAVANATDAAKNAIIAYQNTVLGAQSAELGRQQALLNMKQAQDDLNTAIQTYGPFSDEAAAAGLRFEQAQLAVSSSTLAARDKLDAMNAAAAANPALIGGMIAKLQEQKASLGDSTGAIQAEIDKLYAMQAAIDNLHDKQVRIDTIYTETHTSIANSGGGAGPTYYGSTTGNAALDAYLGSLAHGGVITAAASGMVMRGPGLVLAGEAGMEAVLPLTRPADMVSTIKNTGMANQIAAAAVAAGGGGSGHDTLTVNLVVDGKVLARTVQTGLLKKRRQGSSLGFS